MSKHLILSIACIFTLMMGKLVEGKVNEIESVAAFGDNGLPGSTNGLRLNGIRMNGIKMNGIRMNGIRMNGVALNGIRINGVRLNGIRMNGADPYIIELNGVTIDGQPINVEIPGSIMIGITLDFIRELFTNGTLTANSTEVELLPYLVRCTLDPKDSFKVTINGTERVYPGSFGLAPSFEYLPMTLEQEELVSACLLSHVNYFGKHVRISIRNVPYVPATMDEMIEYGVYEGAFFGSIFTEKESFFSCVGDSTQYALVNSPDRVDRVCTENMTCDFMSMGLCSQSCNGFIEHYGYSNCIGSDGKEYPAMNVYLRSNPNSASSKVTASPATITLGVVVGILVIALVGVSVFTYTRLH